MNWVCPIDGLVELPERIETGGWDLDRRSPDFVVRQLSQLPPNHAAVPGYYQRLVDSEDEILRIGGLTQLLSLGVLPRNLWETAVELSDRGAVRTRAFEFFLKNDETDWARKVLAVPFDAADDFDERRMHLRLVFDRVGQLRLEAAAFLRDGLVQHLITAIELAETIGGWRRALPWAVRSLMIVPDDRMAFRLLERLKQSNQLAILRKAIDGFRTARRFPAVQTIFIAFLQLSDGQPAAALKILSARPAVCQTI